MAANLLVVSSLLSTFFYLQSNNPWAETSASVSRFFGEMFRFVPTVVYGRHLRFFAAKLGGRSCWW